MLQFSTAVYNPKGKLDHEFLSATDVNMTVKDIIECYTGRRTIEVVFRERKQYIRMNDP